MARTTDTASAPWPRVPFETAEMMLPEAYRKGGAITGVFSLLGFLAVIFFKTLE